MSVTNDPSKLRFSLKSDIISNMPDDVANLVFQRCNLEDLFRCERVCKMWREKVQLSISRRLPEYAHHLSNRALVIFSSFDPWLEARNEGFKDIQKTKNLIGSHFSGAFSFKKTLKPDLIPHVQPFPGDVKKLSSYLKKGQLGSFFQCATGEIFFRDFSKEMEDPVSSFDDYSFAKNENNCSLQSTMQMLSRSGDSLQIVSIVDRKILFNVTLDSRIEIKAWHVNGPYLFVISSDGVRVWDGKNVFKMYPITSWEKRHVFFRNTLLVIDSSCKECMIIHIQGEEISQYFLSLPEKIAKFESLARIGNLNFALATYLISDGHHLFLIKWIDGGKIEHVPLDSFILRDIDRPCYSLNESFYIFDFDPFLNSGGTFFNIHELSTVSDEKKIYPVQMKTPKVAKTYFYRHLAVILGGNELIVFNFHQKNYMTWKIDFQIWEKIDTMYKNFLLFATYTSISKEEQEVKIHILDLLQLPTKNHIEALDEVSFSFNISSREKISQWLFDGKILVGVSEDNTYSFSYPFRADMQDVEMKDSQEEIEELPINVRNQT